APVPDRDAALRAPFAGGREAHFEARRLPRAEVVGEIAAAAALDREVVARGGDDSLEAASSRVGHFELECLGAVHVDGTEVELTRLDLADRRRDRASSEREGIAESAGGEAAERRARARGMELDRELFGGARPERVVGISQQSEVAALDLNR